MQGFQKVVRKIKKKPAAKPARKETRNQRPAPASAVRNGPGEKVAKSQGGHKAAQGAGANQAAAATQKKIVSYNNNCNCTNKVNFIVECFAKLCLCY